MQIGFKKIFTIVSVCLLLWLSLRFLLPLFSPFLLGTCLALASEPMVAFLTRRLRLPRPVSSGIGVSMTFALLSMLLLMVCAFVVKELRALTGILPDVELTIQNGSALLRSWLMELASRTPGSVRPLLQENVNSLFSDSTALLDQAVRYFLGLAGNLLSHIPDSALTLGTTVLSGFMISAKLRKIRVWILRRFPKERLRAVLAAGRRIRQAAFGWFLAQLKLMGVTFGILLSGFLLLRISHAPVWAAAVSLVDAFPVLGTGTVLLPWSLLCLLQGQTARAIGILSTYITVSLIRSALEPRLVGRQLGLDPLVTLIALYAGFRLWGIGGMILAPMLTVISMQILPERNTGSAS